MKLSHLFSKPDPAAQESVRQGLRESLQADERIRDSYNEAYEVLVAWRNSPALKPIAEAIDSLRKSSSARHDQQAELAVQKVRDLAAQAIAEGGPFFPTLEKIHAAAEKLMKDVRQREEGQDREAKYSQTFGEVVSTFALTGPGMTFLSDLRTYLACVTKLNLIAGAQMMDRSNDPTQRAEYLWALATGGEPPDHCDALGIIASIVDKKIRDTRMRLNALSQ